MSWTIISVDSTAPWSAAVAVRQGLDRAGIPVLQLERDVFACMMTPVTARQITLLQLQYPITFEPTFLDQILARVPTDNPKRIVKTS